MRRMQLLILAIVVALGTLTASDADAQTAGHKVGRGLAAIACGFLEVPGNIVKETDERGAVGVPIGLAIGLGMFVARELVGLYEVLSAPFPAPPGYRPILDPEYPWDYFE